MGLGQGSSFDSIPTPHRSVPGSRFGESASAEADANVETHALPGEQFELVTITPSGGKGEIIRGIIPTGESALEGKRQLTIGRSSQCDLCLPHDDNAISRTHASVEWNLRGSQMNITDLESTNGTAVNGTRLEPNKAIGLRDGDTITMGQHIFSTRVVTSAKFPYLALVIPESVNVAGSK